jgi:hypothetical protein
MRDLLEVIYCLYCSLNTNKILLKWNHDYNEQRHVYDGICRRSRLAPASENELQILEHQLNIFAIKYSLQVLVTEARSSTMYDKDTPEDVPFQCLLCAFSPGAVYCLLRRSCYHSARRLTPVACLTD